MRGVATAAAAGIVLAGMWATPAHAADNVDVRGACSAGSEWRLKVEPRTATRLRVEFEVDSDVPGQTWAVRITDNGAEVFSGTRVTQDGSGEFRVRRATRNQPGPDTVVATASNTATGETCTAEGTY